MVITNDQIILYNKDILKIETTVTAVLEEMSKRS